MINTPWAGDGGASVRTPFAQRTDSLVASDIAGASPKASYVRRRVPVEHREPNQQRCTPGDDDKAPATSARELCAMVRKHKLDTTAGSWQQGVEGSSPRQLNRQVTHSYRRLDNMKGGEPVYSQHIWQPFDNRDIEGARPYGDASEYAATRRRVMHYHSQTASCFADNESLPHEPLPIAGASYLPSWVPDSSPRASNALFAQRRHYQRPERLVNAASLLADPTTM